MSRRPLTAKILLWSEQAVDQTLRELRDTLATLASVLQRVSEQMINLSKDVDALAGVGRSIGGDLSDAMRLDQKVANQ